MKGKGHPPLRGVLIKWVDFFRKIFIFPPIIPFHSFHTIGLNDSFSKSSTGFPQKPFFRKRGERGLNGNSLVPPDSSDLLSRIG